MTTDKTKEYRDLMNKNENTQKVKSSEFEKKAGNWLKSNGYLVDEVGDEKIRKIYSATKNQKFADIVCVHKLGHELLVGDAKGGSIDYGKVRMQFEATIPLARIKHLNCDIIRVMIFLNRPFIVNVGSGCSAHKSTDNNIYILHDANDQPCRIKGSTCDVQVIFLPD